MYSYYIYEWGWGEGGQFSGIVLKLAELRWLACDEHSSPCEQYASDELLNLELNLERLLKEVCALYDAILY